MILIISFATLVGINFTRVAIDKPLAEDGSIRLDVGNVNNKYTIHRLRGISCFLH